MFSIAGVLEETFRVVFVDLAVMFEAVNASVRGLPVLALASENPQVRALDVCILQSSY